MPETPTGKGRAGGGLRGLSYGRFCKGEELRRVFNMEKHLKMKNRVFLPFTCRMELSYSPMGKLLEKFNPALLEYIYRHALF